MKSRSGFTLVEMALTLGVLGIGLSILFALLPATASSSRGYRDRQRIEVFADRVFATLEWSLRTPAEGVTPPDPELVMALPSFAGSQPLRETKEEILFPGLDLKNDLLPKLYYTLTLTTNQVNAVEALLQVRPFAETEIREFRRTFAPEWGAW